MHLESVRDWLVIVSTGLGIGVLILTAAWKLMMLPNLQHYVFDPIADLNGKVADIEKELHPNGGGSLRDRIDRGVTQVQDTASLLAGHIEEAQQDRRLMLRLERKLNDHLAENQRQERH